jgi:hypothetical protein
MKVSRNRNNLQISITLFTPKLYNFFSKNLFYCSNNKKDKIVENKFNQGDKKSRTGNYKTLMKETDSKKAQINGKILCVH